MSSRVGAPHTLVLGGVCCLAGAAWFAPRCRRFGAAVRPIYVRMGILPQVAAGISDAAELPSRRNGSRRTVPFDGQKRPPHPFRAFHADNRIASAIPLLMISSERSSDGWMSSWL